MKNKCYRDSKSKHQLIETLQTKKSKGAESVIWKVQNANTLKEIQKRYRIEKFEIVIYTRKLYAIPKNCNKLLIEINTFARKGKRTVTVPFEQNICTLLNKWNIHFDIRYKIYLS